MRTKVQPLMVQGVTGKRELGVRKPNFQPTATLADQMRAANSSPQTPGIEGLIGSRQSEDVKLNDDVALTNSATEIVISSI